MNGSDDMQKVSRRLSDDYDSELEYDEGSEVDGEEQDIVKRFYQIREGLRTGSLELRDGNVLERFLSENSSYLCKSSKWDRNTLLHLLVNDARDTVFDKYKPLIQDIVENHPEILGWNNSTGQTPLFLAIWNRREMFLRFVCHKHPNIDSTLTKINAQSEGFLHLAFRRNVNPALAVFLVGLANHDSLTARDRDGRTPLHLAVDYNRCIDGQLDVVQALLLKCDKAMDLRTNQPDSLSPFLYHERTRLDHLEKRVESIQARVQELTAAEATPSRPKLEPTKMSMRSQDPDSLEKTGMLTNRKLKVETDKGPEKGTKSRSQRVSSKTADAVRQYLKLHCLRTRRHDQAINFLYGRSQGKQIHFDLFDAPSLKVNQDRLENGFDNLIFEDILQYVALPRFEVEQKQAIKFSKRTTTDGIARTDMVFFFQFLRSKGVKRIIQVIVDDTVSPAHSDEAIETALRSFDIEICDWRKRDISIEAIMLASPNVREISLYWGGNAVVLRGWVMELGVHELEKLDTINLHVGQTLETTTRTRQSIDMFQKNLNELAPHLKPNIMMNTQPQIREIPRNESNFDQKADHQHLWFRSMDQFADDLQNINISRDSAIEPISIAVIDDGVDITDRRIVTKIMDGQSFLHRDTFQNRTVPYYVTATGHGTVVAVLVCRIFPRAKILALKLDERSDAQGARRTTLISATKSVRVAMEKNVDVIAIAWSVKKTLQTESDIEEFKSAMHDASRQGIIIFCATHDQPPGINTASPASIRNNDVISIGAAGAIDQGGRLRETRNGADFIFPGSDTSSNFPNDPSTDKQESIPEVDVATALAAGLAGLLLYYVKLGATLSTASQLAHESVTMDDFAAFKSHEKMKKAFMSFGTSEHNLLDVWGSFERTRKRIERRRDRSMTDIIVGIAVWLVSTGGEW